MKSEGDRVTIGAWGREGRWAGVSLFAMACLAFAVVERASAQGIPRRQAQASERQRVEDANRQAVQNRARELNGLIDKYRSCIDENWAPGSPGNVFVRNYNVFCLDKNPCSLKDRLQGLDTLRAAANRGDVGTFNTMFRKVVLADCFECGGSSPMARNKHGPATHTAHIHCTMDCGGNNGLFEGPCHKTCLGGHQFNTWVTKLGNDIGQALSKAGKWVETAVKDVGKEIGKAGKWVETAVKDVGKEISKAGDALMRMLSGAKDWIEQHCKEIVDIVIPGSGFMVCMVRDFVSLLMKNNWNFGKAWDALWKGNLQQIQDASQEAEEILLLIGQGLVDILDDDVDLLSSGEAFKRGFDRITSSIGEFLKVFQGGMRRILGIWHEKVMKAMPFPLDKLLEYATSALLTGLGAGGIFPLAGLHHLTMNLIDVVLPKMILGIGNLEEWLQKNLPPALQSFKGLVGEIMKMVGAAGGGLIDILVRDKEKKAKIQSILKKVSQVSGKISEVIGKVTDIADKIAEGSLQKAQEMLSGAAATATTAAAKPPKIEWTKETVAKVLPELSKFTKEEIFNLVKDPVHKLVAKLLGLLHKLLEIPKNAIGSAIGAIPFVGGIISRLVVDTLYGFGVDKIDGFIYDKVDQLVRVVVNKVLDRVFVNLEYALNGSLSPGSQALRAPFDLPPGSWGVQIQEATYGDNRGADLGNQTEALQAHCKATPAGCTFRVQDRKNNIPAGPSPPTFVARYRCNNVSELRTVAAKEGDTVTLKCGSPCDAREVPENAVRLNLVSASFAGRDWKGNIEKRCDAQLDELTKDMRALGIKPKGKRWCAYRATVKTYAVEKGQKSEAELGLKLPPMPKDGPRKLSVDWCCSGDPNPKRVEVEENQIAVLYCRPKVTRRKPEQASPQEVQRFFDFLKRIGDLGNAVSESVGAAAEGAGPALAMMVKTGLEKFLLRGIPDEGLRTIIATALSAVVKRIVEGAQGGFKGFDFAQALQQVVHEVRTTGKLPDYLAGLFPVDASVRSLISAGIDTALSELEKANFQQMIGNPLEFLKRLTAHLVDGLKTPLARLLATQVGDPSIEADIVKSIDVLKDAIVKGGIQALLNFRELFGNLFPSLMSPLLKAVLGFLKTPDLAALRDGLRKGVEGMRPLLDAIGAWIREKKAPTALAVVSGLAKLAGPVGSFFIEKLKKDDQAAGELLQKAYALLLQVAEDPLAFERDLLQQPWKLVGKVAEMAQGLVTSKLTSLLPASDEKLKPEKDLLAGGLASVFEVLTKDDVRTALFGDGQKPVDALAIVSRVASVAGPYLRARIEKLAEGTAFGPALSALLEGLLGKDGALTGGDGALRALPKWFETKGQPALGKVVGATSELLQKQLGGPGKSPFPGAVVKGILGAVQKVLESPGGFGEVVKRGLGGLWDVLQDAAGSVMEAVADASAPPAEAGAQASPVKSLIRKAIDAIKGFFRDPRKLLSQAAEALNSAAPGFGKMVGEMLKGFLSPKIPDPALRPIVDKWIDAFFDLASHPDQVKNLSGAQVLEAVRAGGADLLGYIEPKITGALPEAVRGLASAVLGDLRKLVGSAAELRSLIEGDAKAIVSRAVRVLGPPLAKLAVGALPASAKGPVGSLLDGTIAFLGDPAQVALLANPSAQTLLPKLADPLKRFLKSILGAVGPPEAQAQLSQAVDLVGTALANPAGLAEAAGLAARKAVDAVLSPLLAKIDNAPLRELLQGALAILKDLTGSDETAKALRSGGGALVERVARVVTGYLQTLVGDAISDRSVRAFVLGSLDGLRELVTATGSLAQKASAALPGMTRRLAALIGELLERAIPHPAVGKLVGGLAREGLEILGDPQNWRDLLQQGLGFLLSRVVPAVKDFAVSLLRDAQGVDPTLRGVVERVVTAAGAFLSDRRALQDLKSTIVPWLLSTAVGALSPVVIEAVDQKVKNPALSRFIRRLVEGLTEALSDVRKVQELFSLAPKALLEKAVALVQPVLADLFGAIFKDESLRRLAVNGMDILLDGLVQAVATKEVGGALKGAVAKAIPLTGNFLKEKLLSLFPNGLESLKDAVSNLFDALLAGGADLVATPEEGWKRLTQGGGAALFGRVVKRFLPSLRDLATGRIGSAAAKGLVSRLFESLGELLDDPAATLRAFKTAQGAVAFFLPKIGRVLKPFLEEMLVQPVQGGARPFVQLLVDGAMGMLERPEKLWTLIQRVKNRAFKEIIQDLLDGMAPALLSGLNNEGLKGMILAGVQAVLQKMSTP
jgi:hypothetical protein